MKNEEIQKLDFSRWPLPDEFLIELGRVSALWAGLEGLLNMCLGKLSGFNDLNNPMPFILVTHASMPQRLDMLSALCELLAPTYTRLANYKDVITKLKSAQALRNKFLHHTIGLDPETGQAEIAIGSARGTLKANVEKIDIADIRRAVISIDEAQTALCKLVLGKDMPPVWQRLSQKNAS